MSAGASSRVARWALPGELAGLPPGRRTVRDWLVDVVLFGFALAWWVWGLRDLVVSAEPEYVDLVPGWMITVDPWLGFAACAAVFWRRRFPLGYAIVMVPVLTIAGTSAGAALVSIFTVAIHRRWLPAAIVLAVQTAQVVTFSFAWQPAGQTPTSFAITNTLLFATPFVCGLVVRFRRQLILSLRREAEIAHERRLGEARRSERDRIAREMHDVLAHRISLLSVHAGALAYRTGQADAGAGKPLTAAEMAEAVRVIRDNAHHALAELGEVLSVLRTGDPAEDGPRAAPAPGLPDLSRLADEAQAAGQPVDLEVDGVLTAQPSLRPQEQRTVYRLVQEGLTNARKHAPGAPVLVRVTGSPGAGLDVAVTNPLPAEPASAGIPGGGTGLAGLAERVALDGGTLEHGRANGSFRLAAHLPWRTPD
jgi:signal transduction histidine kinase